MFTQFASWLSEGDSLNITITKRGERLITSLIPKKSGLKDEAKQKLTPLVVSGTPEELESGFIGAVSEPLRQASGILCNMRDFEKSVAETEANSKARKAEEEKKKKETESRKKKYDEYIRNADEQEKTGKINEAVLSLKEAVKYANGNASAVQGRIQKLHSRLNSNSLFGNIPGEDNYSEGYDAPDEDSSEKDSDIQDVEFEEEED